MFTSQLFLNPYNPRSTVTLSPRFTTDSRQATNLVFVAVASIARPRARVLEEGSFTQIPQKSPPNRDGGKSKWPGRWVGGSLSEGEGRRERGKAGIRLAVGVEGRTGVGR